MKKLFNHLLEIGKGSLRLVGKSVVWILKNQPGLIFKAFDQKTFAYKNADTLGKAVKNSVTTIEEYISNENLPDGLSANDD